MKSQQTNEPQNKQKINRAQTDLKKIKKDKNKDKMKYKY